MRLYLDTCCYNRPFDNLSQERIREEADAILSIITVAHLKRWEIVGSAVAITEIAAIQNKERRVRVAAMYRIASGFVETDELVKKRAEYFQHSGMHVMDSLHVALAEKANATFVTVDDKLVNYSRL